MCTYLAITGTTCICSSAESVRWGGKFVCILLISVHFERPCELNNFMLLSVSSGIGRCFGVGGWDFIWLLSSRGGLCLPYSRGVWGHALPGKFGLLHLLRSILVCSEHVGSQILWFFGGFCTTLIFVGTGLDSRVHTSDIYTCIIITNSQGGLSPPIFWTGGGGAEAPQPPRFF